jgi:hypothetical protein
VVAWSAGLTAVADFWLWGFVRKRLCEVVAERIQRPFAGVTPCPLKRLDSGNEMTRDEDQL